MPANQITVRLWPSGGVLTVRQTGATFPNLVLRNQQMISRAEDFTPLWTAFHPVWQQSIARDVFAAQGPGWPALSPAYAARKTGPGMMRETDRLYQSLVSNTGDSVFETSPRSMKKGSNVPYLPYHQTGTSRMPARPVLVLQPELLERLAAAQVGYVTSGRVRF